MPRLVITTLGAFQARLQAQPITTFRSDKVRALLVYLACQADQPQTRDHLIGLLWPEEPESTARHNLRQALLVLRKAIGDEGAVPPHLLITSEAIQFNAQSDFDLDTARFTTLLADCRTHRHRRAITCQECLARLTEATALYRGDFLAQFIGSDSHAFGDWVAFQREALRRQALEALFALAESHEQRGDYPQAQHFAARQLAIEPWREEAHRQLMRSLALSGQRSTALAQYETCRAVLRDELHAEPEAATQRLHADLQAGHLPVAHTSSAKAYLPTALNSLIGRELEVAHIKTRLLDKRFVTLVGPGGVGKTRLAQQVASELAEEFEQGVWWVALDAIWDPANVITAIAHALGVIESDGAPTLLAIRIALRNRQLLLVLDNFEQVLAAGPVVVELLAYAPQLEVLITSRAALGLPGEQRVEVAPLSVSTASLAELEPCPAVALLVERAQAHRTDFRLNADNVQALGEICARLDGLPLAIELAAAWLKSLSPAQLAERLGQRLTLLASPVHANVATRQSTLRSVLDWSHALLSAEAQSCLQRVSVFEGGWGLEAAGAVGGGQTTEALSALVDHSLVSAAEHKGRMRYRLLETIRDYAFEKLEASDEAPLIHQRHAAHYHALAQAAEPHLRGAHQARRLQHLADEHDNLRAALGWELAHQPERALQLAVVLSRFWERRTHLSEGRRWLEAALQATSVQPDVWRARALGSAGMLAFMQGDHEKAQRLSQAGADLARQLADEDSLQRALQPLALALMMQGALAEAQRLLENSIAFAHTCQDRHLLADALRHLAGLAIMRGDLVGSANLHRQALGAAEACADEYVIAVELCRLGQIAVVQNQPVEAASLLRESVRYCQAVGDRFYLCQTIGALAGVAMLERKLVLAARLLGAEEVARESLGVTPSPAQRLFVEALFGRLREALDEATLQAVWAEGRQLNLEAAITYALG